MEKATLDAMSSLTSQLALVTAQIYRAQGANIEKTWTQEYSLDNKTTKENPIDKVIYDFQSFKLSDGTDDDTYLYVILDRVNGGKRGFKVKNNDGLNCSVQCSEITIYSPAQPGKKISLTLFKDADFRSGSMVMNGTVGIKAPTTRVLSNIAIGANTTTSILPQDVLRKRATIVNKTGLTLWLGPAGVSNTGANTGVEFLNGEKLEDVNTAELFVFSTTAAATGLTVLVEA